MKRSLPENLMFIVGLVLLGVVLFLFVPSIGYADNGHGHDHGGDVTNDISTGGVDVSSGDVNVGGNTSRALALGNALGDVDIAHCLGSTQWSTPVYGKQKLTLNWVCVAEFYIRYQQPELAAMALCNTDILKEFPTEEECEQAHQFLVLAAVQPAHVEESEQVHNRQETQLMEMQSQLEQLRELYERRPARTVTRQVEQVPLLTEEQRSKLREIKE